jgi:hypothetical protein
MDELQELKALAGITNRPNGKNTKSDSLRILVTQVQKKLNYNVNTILNQELMLGLNFGLVYHI